MDSNRCSCHYFVREYYPVRCVNATKKDSDYCQLCQQNIRDTVRRSTVKAIGVVELRNSTFLVKEHNLLIRLDQYAMPYCYDKYDPKCNRGEKLTQIELKICRQLGIR